MMLNTFYPKFFFFRFLLTGFLFSGKIKIIKIKKNRSSQKEYFFFSQRYFQDSYFTGSTDENLDTFRREIFDFDFRIIGKLS